MQTAYKISIGVAVAVIVIAGLYLWLPRAPATPSIVVQSPTAKDIWSSGSVHTISWQTQNIPSEDKVSITIRRIPPPPLPQDGQEFDPIVFTDLPNNGSASWTISSMYPDGTYVLGIHAYTSVPITKEVEAESAPFSIKHPSLSQDLYPLYGKVYWDAPIVDTVTIGTTTFNGASITSEPVTNTMDPGSVFTPFERFYAQKLASLGWKVASDLAAGGHVGGQTGYRKGSQIILTRFAVKYQNVTQNAPSECPCNVTLSLFSSQAK